MSYFAKPNFIIYDEWFDDDLEKTKFEVQNKKIKNISYIHEFFYKQSNYKVGASENNVTQSIKLNQKELITNNYLENSSFNFSSVSKKELSLFKRRLKSKIKSWFKKRIIYFLSIFCFLIIFGIAVFFIS